MNLSNTHITHVGLIEGDGHEGHLSRQTADYLHSHLKSNFTVSRLQASQDDTWKINGKTTTPSSALSTSDVALNAAVGKVGEKNMLHPHLHMIQPRYLGAGGLASAQSFNKNLAKKLFSSADIKTPKWRTLSRRDTNLRKQSKEIFRSLPFPAIVKPAKNGAGKGVRKADSHQALMQAISNAFEYDDTVIVEEYISGQEVSVGILEYARGDDLYTLPPIALNTHSQPSFAYERRTRTDYSPLSHRNDDIKKKVSDLARRAHKILNLRHWSRADIIISEKRGAFLLEVNAIPHLGEHAPYTYALEQAGMKPEYFTNHLVSLAARSK